MLFLLIIRGWNEVTSTVLCSKFASTPRSLALNEVKLEAAGD